MTRNCAAEWRSFANSSSETVTVPPSLGYDPERGYAGVETLEGASLSYLIVGALACSAWAMPRSTNDADFVVACSAPDLETVIRKLPSPIKPDPQARMEPFTGTVRWILTIEESSFQIELFLLGSDSHHAEMFRRKCRQRIEMLDRQVWLPTAEDLIIQKVRWGRRKDLDDAVNILAVQGGAIDFEYVETWCCRHGTSKTLRELRAAIGPDL